MKRRSMTSARVAVYTNNTNLAVNPWRDSMVYKGLDCIIYYVHSKCEKGYKYLRPGLKKDQGVENRVAHPHQKFSRESPPPPRPPRTGLWNRRSFPARFNTFRLQMKGELFALWLDYLVILVILLRYELLVCLSFGETVSFQLYFSVSVKKVEQFLILSVPFFNCLCYFLTGSWTISFFAASSEIHVYLVVTAAHNILS